MDRNWDSEAKFLTSPWREGKEEDTPALYVMNLKNACKELPRMAQYMSLGGQMFQIKLL